ncbi:MAG TPA: amidohydrolase family protein [Chloroflexota bacterium]|jgi:L-fuconolactonase
MTPNLPIVDAHVHLWDPQRLRMPWLDGNPLLNRRYDLGDFTRASAGLDVQGLVYIQTDVAESYALLEAQWVAELARQDACIRAIVPFAPLEYGDRVRAFLDALVSISPLIKGVRRIYQGAPVDFCLQPDFVRGVQLLPDYGLSCDLCIRHHQLENTVTLVQQCPATQFILDHIAKPDIAAQLLDPWRQHMRQLAAFPNVYCKISGVLTEADHQRWTVEDAKPFILHALEVFGVDRVAFGGDWPVVLEAAAYRRWIDTLDVLTAALPLDSRQKLWAENAIRFYRL